jgi:hypothetical protein
MAELNCPLCGSLVRIPSSVEINTRYLCKKCHTPFHMNRSRDLLVGEPPSVEEDVAQLKQNIQQFLASIPVGRIAGGLAAFAVVCLALYFLLGPSQKIDGPAERAARALADNDVASLKSLAASGTADDVARWYDAVHPRLLQARKNWHGRDEDVEVHVGQVDRARRSGSVVLSIHAAALGSSRDVSIADPSVATAAAAGSFDVETVWTLNGWGHWKLDGRETYARTQPAP